MQAATNIGELIKPSNGVRYIKTEYGDTKDIINQVMEADAYDLDDVQDFALYMDEGDVATTCRNIFDFIVDNIEYREDKDGEQWVCSPSWLYQRGWGDCKSFAKFITSCLKQLDIKYLYRFCGGSQSADVHHVFVIAFDEAGNEIAIDATPDNSFSKPTFGEEPYYVKKIDRRPAAVAATKIGKRQARRLDIAGLSREEANEWYHYLSLTDPEAAALFEKQWSRTASASRIGIKFFPQLAEGIAQKKINTRLRAFFKADIMAATPFFTYFFWPLSKNKSNYLPPEAQTKLRRALILFTSMGLKYATVNYQETPRILLPIFIGLRNFLDANIDNGQPEEVQNKQMMDAFREMWEKPFKDTLIFKEHVLRPAQEMIAKLLSETTNANAIVTLYNGMMQGGVQKYAPADTLAFWSSQMGELPSAYYYGYNAISSSAFGAKEDYANNDSMIGMLRVGVKNLLGEWPEDIIDQAYVDRYMQQPVAAGRSWPQAKVPGKPKDKTYAGLSLAGLSAFDLDHLKEKFPVGSYVYVFTTKVTNDLQRPLNGKHKVLHVGSTNDNSPNFLVLDVEQEWTWDPAWGDMTARITNNPAVMLGLADGGILPYEEAARRYGLSGRAPKKARVGSIEGLLAIVAAAIAVIATIWKLVKDVMASAKNRRLMDNLGPDTVPSPPKDFEICYPGMENGKKVTYCADYAGNWYRIDEDGTTTEVDGPPPCLTGDCESEQAGLGWILGGLLLAGGASVMMQNDKKKPKRKSKRA